MHLAEMGKIAEERKVEEFRWDTKNVKDSEAVVLIGVLGTKKYGLNCGTCGYANRDEFEKAKRWAGQDFTRVTCIFTALHIFP